MNGLAAAPPPAFGILRPWFTPAPLFPAGPRSGACRLSWQPSAKPPRRRKRGPRRPRRALGRDSCRPVIFCSQAGAHFAPKLQHLALSPLPSSHWLLQARLRSREAELSDAGVKHLALEGLVKQVREGLSRPAQKPWRGLNLCCLSSPALFGLTRAHACVDSLFLFQASERAKTLAASLQASQLENESVRAAEVGVALGRSPSFPLRHSRLLRVISYSASVSPPAEAPRI